MATFKRIQPEPPPPIYQLELSKDEAEMLHSLLGRCVAGGPTSPLFHAIDKGGIDGANTYDVDNSAVGAIRVVKLKERY